MHTTETPNPVLVWDLLTAYQRTAALYSAIELDVFRAVGEGPGDVASIARHCGSAERGIRILCDYLTILGVLQKDGSGSYRHSATSAVFLDPSSPTCLAAGAKFVAGPELHEAHRTLTEAVRRGRTALPGQGTVEPENAVWVEFARGMAPMMAPLAGPLASIVLQGRTGPVRVLDIAAGHGLFGIEVAKRTKDATIVALGPYDVVLLTNFLHHFDAETNTRLLRKIFDACAPGAAVATLDFVPHDDRISPPPAAAFSLMMLATTASGDAYTFRELEAMYRNAGFSQVNAHSIPEAAHTVVLGVKA